MEFFRHCPGCGRRFHIKLESKKLVDLERSSRPTREGQLLPGGPGYGVRIGIDVYEGRPIIIDVEQFQYAYKCTHCGHEWFEKHFEEHRER
jgi:hypothetical protein